MLSKKGCDCEIDEITNPLDISKISDEYIEIFRRRNLSDAGEVVFNITSGTKPMFLALFGCTKDLNRNYVYLDTVDKQLIYLNDIKYPQKITNL